MRGAAAPLTAASYMEPVLEPPSNPDAPLILYIDANKRLQVGTWVTTNNGQVTSNNIIFTKFGSTVGSSMTNDSDDWGSGDIKFNPTSTLNATWETAAGYADIPYWDIWPGSKPSSYSTTANPKYLSQSPYHTLKNVKAGFGDICQLVGYTVENIAAWDELPPPTYRLPTNPENSTFIGLASTAATNARITSSTYFKWTSGSPGYHTFPSSKPVKDLILPGVGDRHDDASATDWGIDSHWWSSTPAGTTTGYTMSCYSSGLNMSYTEYAYHSWTVRCVPY